MKLSKFRTLILNSNTKQFYSYLIIWIVTLIPLTSALAQDGANDATFNSGVGANNTVRNAKVQADGKVLVVGDFTRFDGSVANRIVRLLANGNTDASFTTGSGTDFAVRDIAIQSDQKIIIVGDFATYNGVARSGIARLNSDGTLDASFTPGTGANSGIYSIVIQSDGKILIGGIFTNYNGTAINRIARLNSDGTLDTSFVTGSGFDSVVRMLALQADGKVVVAGDFAFYNGQAKIAIARLNTNGTFDTSFAGSGTNLRITAAALQSDGKVLIGGDFTTVNGTAKNRLARLNSDGSVDNSFNAGTGPNAGPDRRVNTFAIEPDGQIIIGGDFNLVNGILRNYIARLNSDGSLDATFNPGTGANNVIYSLTPQADGVIIGGVFFSYNGVTRLYIAKISICQAPTITTVTPGSRCGTGTVTLNATASAGTLNWYSALTGGVSLGTGTSFVTPSISTTTTYYVDATNGGCTSGRSAVVATVGNTQTITGTTPSSRCGTGTLTLSATASAGTLNWYAASSGGSSLGTGTSFTTPSIATATTYYVDASNAGCTSARTAVLANVKTIPTITGTTPGTRCGAGTVSLGAATGGGTLNWYPGPTGGVSLGAGPTFNTPSIATTTSYFVDATNSGCTSARTPVVATINIPTISGTTPSGRCDVGTVTLGATTSAGTLNWYAASSGGASLGTGTSFITPSLSATTTYYVEATNTGCTSARTAVVATISAVPTITGTTPGTRCGTGAVTLSATGSAGTLNWYAASTGGAALGTGLSFTTPSITNTTTYFVDVTDGCTSARTEVVATVNSVPTITGTTPANRCGTGTITLGATTGAGTLNWYAASTGGTSLGTGTSFVTPSIAITTTYYVDVTNNGCTSARTAVIATINPIPTITSTTSNVRCDSGTLTIGATASAGTLNWFGSPTGGPSLGTGTAFTTPVIASTTTYHVEVTNNGCTSPRTAIVANITPTPTITSTTPASRCGAGTVDLSATASAGTLNWYTAATGGSSLASGTTFTTPTIANTTTYYVEAVNNGCTSARSTVIATINPVPSITNSTPATVANCDSGTTTLNASADFGVINWYSVASGGTSLGTGANFITPTITSSTTYYAEASQNGCRSARAAVLATVNETPTITSTSGGSQCNSGSISLSATASGGVISWYADATGGTTLGTGTNFTTPTISATTTYYVQAANNGCTSARTAVVATINATPTIMATTPASRCGTGTVTLSASGSAGILNWFDVATGGTSLGSGNDFTTPSIAATTTFYVEASANGCASSRSSVVATINAVPTIATTTPASAATCDSGSVTLSATAAAGTISWFAAVTGGTALGTGNSFITPLLTTTTTYYVAVTNNGCTSTRTAIVATINATPPRPTISANNTNPVAPVLTSSSSNGNQWFRDAVAISGATGNTLLIQQAGIFTVRVTQQGCVSPFSSEYTYVITALEPTLVNELAIYPNPAVEELVVGLGGFDRVVPIQISIMDIQGRDQHQTSSIGKTEVKIDIRHFTSGQYVVLVEQGKTKLTKRFIKK